MHHTFQRLSILVAFGAVLTSAHGAGPVGVPVPVAPVATTMVTQALSSAGEGRRLWLKLNCYGCHGDRAGGGMGPNVAHAEAGDVSEAVTQGQEGGMPSYRNYVSALDLTNLAIYLRSIGSASEPRFKDWWVPVPTK